MRIETDPRHGVRPARVIEIEPLLGSAGRGLDPPVLDQGDVGMGDGDG
jgi:hypothetical protein